LEAVDFAAADLPVELLAAEDLAAEDLAAEDLAAVVFEVDFGAGLAAVFEAVDVSVSAVAVWSVVASREVRASAARALPAAV
jgi:hypothetical protein